MNEKGKSLYSTVFFSFFTLIMYSSLEPYLAKSGGFDFGLFISDIDYSERLCWFWACAFFSILAYFICHFVSVLFFLLGHFFIRISFLRKLRKPIRIYNGDSVEKSD